MDRHRVHVHQLVLELEADYYVHLNGSDLRTQHRVLTATGAGSVQAWKGGVAKSWRGWGLMLDPWRSGLTMGNGRLYRTYSYLEPGQAVRIQPSAMEVTALLTQFELLFQLQQSGQTDQLPQIHHLVIELLDAIKTLYLKHQIVSQYLADESCVWITRNFSTLVESHYAANHRVDAYARLLHVTPDHLTYCIRATLGMSAKDLLNQRLRDQAVSLLSGTTLPVATIAQQLGFSSLAYFSRFVVRQTGWPPTHWR